MLDRKCVFLLLAIISSLAYSNSITPGSYSVSMKWQQDDLQYVRLGMYSFQSGGSMRSDYWQYNQNSTITFSSGSQIGTTSQYGVPTGDSSKNIQGLSHFLGSNLSTRYGSWTLYGTNIIGIVWSDGSEEYWRRTWSESQLTKIECYYASYSDSPWGFYLWNNGGNFQRNNAAVNAGWGFGGGETSGFTYGKSQMSSFNANYAGLAIEWNNYYSGNDRFRGVSSEWLNLLTYFYPSTTGLERYVWYDGTQSLYVFCYCAIPSNSGMYSRRIMYQGSHDWGTNYHIEDDKGHIMSGLQIIDTNNNGRGMVFVETDTNSTTSGSGYILRALFYIDDSSTAAQTGIGN